MTNEQTGAIGLPLQTPYQIRQELEEAVFKELLGPAGGEDEEVDENSVLDRYLVGMLAPKRQLVRAGESDGLEVAGGESAEEGATDPSALPADTLFPSSFGLTFTVTSEAKSLRIRARWGHYERTHSQYLVNEETGNPKMVWARQQIDSLSPPVPLKEGPLTPWVVTEEQPDVYVRGVMRRNGGDREWIVTLFLVNGQEETKPSRDKDWLFQAELSAESADGQPIFCKRPRHRHQGQLDLAVHAEEQAMAMIYRHHVEFVIGHGVAVHAEVDPANKHRAHRVMTRSIPRYEVPKQTPPNEKDIPALAGLVLDMKELAQTADAEFAVKLDALPDAYRQWIDVERLKLHDPAQGLADFQQAAQEAIGNCDKALTRIQEGLALLGQNPDAAEAFRFANRAMWLQRTRSLFAEKRRRKQEVSEEAVDVPENRTWYPFQLAFILLNLPGLTDLHHRDRVGDSESTADLLWFPTGGGKTEAYLGLAAYTMALRRRQGEVAGRSGHHGMAVLMRYTLRLLTIQQFQRASALICACETIRREAILQGDLRWGPEPFRVGLWVGQKTTPNTTDQSAEAIRQDHGQFGRGNSVGGSGSPAQLLNCPWCGTEINPGTNIEVITVKNGSGRTLTYCGDPMGRCPFSSKQAPGEGIPVIVVDEEIYRRLPDLLIATVDKFAQLPWRGATQMLFGQVQKKCPRHGFHAPDLRDSDSHPQTGKWPAVKSSDHAPLRPPDLIIQDELHLISGPLGSLVGLYETAVDHLMSWEVDGKTVRPKVVASTATIRQAGDQVSRLFLRKVAVFPPQATDVTDNFFSLQREPGEQYPGRLYLGICAPGKRIKATLIRVYVAYLSAAQQLYEKYGERADAWMTLVGYFNSMRELGGMRRLVDDDIKSRLRDMEARGLAKRWIGIPQELTSRRSSSDIPRLLDQLEVVFDPHMEERRKNARKAKKDVSIPYPIDVLLATNMLSVGVDVKRLGLMVTASQPKGTAEYIQATSRVGRNRPGLVCTVYNWARPRDLSHYECFEQYHATFYKHVEALSVTPFSPGALFKGLTAILASLVRLPGEDFNANESAGHIDRHHPYVKHAIDAISRRAERVTCRKEVGENVRQVLNRRIDQWLKLAQDNSGGRQLGYKVARDGLTLPLLHKPSLEPWGDFTCLNSLRDVEPTVNLVLDDRELGDLPSGTAAEALTMSAVDTGEEQPA